MNQVTKAHFSLAAIRRLSPIRSRQRGVSTSRPLKFAAR